MIFYDFALCLLEQKYSFQLFQLYIACFIYKLFTFNKMSTPAERAAARRAKILARGASRMAVVNGEASCDILVS